MEFTIHINVTGLDKLADGMFALAGAAKAKTPAEAEARAPHQQTPTAVQTASPAPAANPSQALAGTTPAGAAGSPAVSVGTSGQIVPFAAASGSTSTFAPAPMQTAPAPAQTAPARIPAQTAPMAGAPAYTKDDLAQPAATWFRADPAKMPERIAALNALNAEFGIAGLDQLPPAQYGAYALRLRQLGVNI